MAFKKGILGYLFSAGGGKKPFWDNDSEGNKLDEKKVFTAMTDERSEVALRVSIQSHGAKRKEIKKVNAAHGYVKFEFTMLESSKVELERALEAPGGMEVLIKPAEQHAEMHKTI